MAVLILLPIVCLLFTQHANAGVPIGFSASQTNGKLDANSQVIFKNVLANVGGAYDVNTGAFTCPKQGLYSFTVGGLSTPGNWMAWDLYVNGRYLITVHAYDRADHTSGSRTVLIECKKSERVYVMNKVAVTVFENNDKTYQHNIFSGFLIEQTY
ncbi:hypothetical protein Btru_038463 [Bulinus truncatus]|nr:hypothetical protein Btru_038463 [Bulinus truncatus]